MCSDHLHRLVEISPKVTISSFMGYLKGDNSLIICQKNSQ
ncbi:hypothetical protein CLOSTMETH_02890 [[Clostridium] methylpentosum DSM 5476]|uniref:Transposase IS200-like domain-containing protein n=1 Tax=[Clostridium] methylpentosum DSM 5476 TaxID=537013 RepID=C0EG97_9FIRM|nr:hypothetical protein CLOSTMETH_02890 [[Clostridium] methylpentosum DSM 5476]